MLLSISRNDHDSRNLFNGITLLKACGQKIIISNPVVSKPNTFSRPLLYRVDKLNTNKIYQHVFGVNSH